MNIKIQKINTHTQLWGLLGPLLIACTLFIVVLRSSAFSWGLPLVAVCGLVLCYKWRWRGVLASLLLLAGVSTQHLIGHSAADWLWTVTLALSIAAAFVVTALTLEEAHHAWEVLSKDAENHRQAIAQVKDSLVSAQNQFQIDRQELLTRLEHAKDELRAREGKLQSSTRLIDIVRDELTVMHEERGKLLEELFQMRQQAAANGDSPMNLAANNHELQARTLTELSQKLVLRDEEIHQLNSQIEAVLMEQRLARQQIATDAAEMAALRQQQKVADMHMANSQAEQMRQRATINELGSHIDMLKMEKELLEASLSGLQSELEHLGKQKQQQAQSTEAYQASLQSLQTLADKYAAELHREQASVKTLKSDFEIKEQSLKQQLAEVNDQLAATAQQLAEWEEKESEYAALANSLMALKAQAKADHNGKEHLERQCKSLSHEIQQAHEKYRLALANENLLQETCDGLQDALAQAQKECQSAAAQETHLQAQCNGLLQEIERTREKYRAAVADQSQLHHQYEALNQDLERTQQRYEVAVAQEGQLRQTLESMELRCQQFDSLKMQHEKAQAELAHFEGIKSNYQALALEQSNLQSVVDQLSAEKAALELQLQEVQPALQTMPPTMQPQGGADIREIRRLEGLYQQLREQFSQKTATLDTTRRELFHTQEKLSAVQREVEESELNGDSEVDSLSSLLAATERELVAVEQEYANEVASLHELISGLMTSQCELAMR